MPKKVLSSWTSTADGQLIEQDMKVTYNEDDGSYELEVTKDSLGVTLGVDPDVEMYTILSRISEPAR